MPAPAPQPITVNFNVAIDASGNLDIFNTAAPTVSNVIVAEHILPVAALYDPDNAKGLLELWEPSDAQGDIKVQLADTDRVASGGLDLTGAYQVAAKALASGLEAILCDSFDCSGALPFSGYMNNVGYYKQRDFGRVALATYAHYLFGHVDATAAITNDKAFVEGMLSVNAAGADETEGGAAARAAAWTKSTIDNVQAWDVSSSSADANLALRLVKAIVAKGLDGTGVPIPSLVSTEDSSSLANIVAQVVGQDASRLMNVDSSQRTRDQHILLRFYPGDVIYMNITLKEPNVNIGSKNQLVSKAALEAMYPLANNNFTLKITLGTPPTGIVVPDYLWAQTFKTGSNGFVNYDTARLVTNTPTGTGNAYRTTGQSNLYIPTSFSPTNTVSFCTSMYLSNAALPYSAPIFTRYYGAPASGIQFSEAGSIGYSWNDGDNTYRHNTGINLPLNTWAHIVLTITSSNAKWYINGNLSNTFVNSHAALSWTQTYVGCDNFTQQNRTVQGYLDNLRFYTRTLSASEVQTIYQNTLVA